VLPVEQIYNKDIVASHYIVNIQLYVTVAQAASRWLEAGDRVRRAAAYKGEGWCLGGRGDGCVGVVLQVCTARVD
jgi:hypothetical protein